jgi:site-specific DNA-methyltransferase (adenine-specific)
LEVPRSHETEHPNEKPVDLLKKLIESTTSEHDLVIDPFAGCASTLIASLKLNRNFWGAEIEEQFFEEGSARLVREANTNG